MPISSNVLPASVLLWAKQPLGGARHRLNPVSVKANVSLATVSWNQFFSHHVRNGNICDSVLKRTAHLTSHCFQLLFQSLQLLLGVSQCSKLGAAFTALPLQPCLWAGRSWGEERCRDASGALWPVWTSGRIVGGEQLRANHPSTWGVL